jgi:hypothetical protein
MNIGIGSTPNAPARVDGLLSHAEPNHAGCCAAFGSGGALQGRRTFLANLTDDLIILDVTFIQGRPKETRLALLKDINTRVAAAAAVMMITLHEVPGENISFGQGEAQRAHAVARA